MKLSFARRTIPFLTTVILSIVGAFTGKIRVTPIPPDFLRTEMVSETEPPFLATTKPSKAWIRSFLPSFTQTSTRTVSPTRISGISLRICFSLILSTKFAMINILSINYYISSLLHK